MEISSEIDVLNIQTVYEAVAIKTNDKKYKYNMFTNKLVDLLNHVSISLHFTNVSMLEYYFLKKYINDGLTRFKPYDRDTNVMLTKEKFNDLPKKYIDYIDNGLNNLGDPIGFFFGECYAMLNGANLITIFDLSPEQFFYTLPNGKDLQIQNENGLSLRTDGISLIDFNQFRDHVIDIFNFKFQKFMIGELHEQDFILDSIIHSSFLKEEVRPNEIVKMLFIYSPYGNIDIAHGDMDSNMEMISSIKSRINEFTTKKDFKCEFLITSDLYDFITFIDIYGFKYITSQTGFRPMLINSKNGDIRYIGNDKQTLIDMISNMSENYMNATVTEDIMQMGKDGKPVKVGSKDVTVDNHKEMNFISSGTTVKFMVSLSLDDVNNIINLYNSNYPGLYDIIANIKENIKMIDDIFDFDF